MNTTLNTPLQDTPLNILNGKTIFVFDTETTGLPEKGPTGFGSYWDYRMNNKYDNSRIVSIAWSFINNYSNKNITNKIEHFIRHPEGFTEIPTAHIHGITFDFAFENGIKFNDILENCGLGELLLSSDYIVAHNAKFDLHILLNELYRLGTELAIKCILHLLNMKNSGKVICTAEIGADICKLDFPSKSSYQGKKIKTSYKMPKLSELYKYYYAKDFENQHSANGDVLALLEIMKMM